MEENRKVENRYEQLSLNLYDSQSSFIQFYSDLIQKYEKTIKTRTVIAMIAATGFCLSIALLVLYITLNSLQ